MFSKNINFKVIYETRAFTIINLLTCKSNYKLLQIVVSVWKNSTTRQPTRNLTYNLPCGVEFLNNIPNFSESVLFVILSHKYSYKSLHVSQPKNNSKQYKFTKVYI